MSEIIPYIHESVVYDNKPYILIQLRVLFDPKQYGIKVVANSKTINNTSGISLYGCVYEIINGSLKLNKFGTGCRIKYNGWKGLINSKLPAINGVAAQHLPDRPDEVFYENIDLDLLFTGELILEMDSSGLAFDDPYRHKDRLQLRFDKGKLKKKV